MSLKLDLRDMQVLQMPSTLNFKKVYHELVTSGRLQPGTRVAVTEKRVQSTTSGSQHYLYERLFTCAKKRKDGMP